MWNICDPYASDPGAYNAFVKQWFFEVKIPEYRYLEKPRKSEVQGRWEVRARLQNVGSARMPVEVAAIKGNRFIEPDKFKKSSLTITLGEGESKDILILCDFEPERLVVDPELQVFQLQRKATSFRFN